MNCQECREELRVWLVGELEGGSADLPHGVRTHTDTCDECAKAARAALRLTDATSLVVAPPPYLASRVRAHLRGGDSSAKRRGWILIPAAFAAAVALGVWLLPQWLPSSEESQSPPTAVLPGDTPEVIVEFRLEAPRARAVAVVGDWNEWDPQADRLSDRDGDGVWEITVRLIPSREYRYQFQVDGETWVPDPHAPLTIDDGFGGRTSVLQL
jgi:hypothetical protein